jgi:hypothetical protein
MTPLWKVIRGRIMIEWVKKICKKQSPTPDPNLATAVYTLAIVNEGLVNQIALVREEIHLLRLALEKSSFSGSDLGTLDNPMVPLEDKMW